MSELSAESSTEKVPDIKRAKTPPVIQIEPAECGAAALGIVLAYHGKHLPLEELRAKCAVSRDGCRLDNMIRAAQGYGMHCKAYQTDLSELASHQMPIILFWRFNHFVVLEGVRDDKVYINDPSHGHLVLTQDEFDRSFTGVILSLEPESSFEAFPKKPALWTSLKPRLNGSLWALAYVILAGLGLATIGLLFPYLTRFFIDEIFIGQNDNWLTPLLLIMAVVTLLQIVFFYLQRQYLLRLEIKLAIEQSARFFWHLLRLPMSFFSQRMAGDLDSRLGINDRVAVLLSDRLASIIIQFISLFVFLIAMLYIDVILTLACVVTALANLLILRWVSHRRISENLKLIRLSSRLMGTSMHGLAIIENLKASGTESDFFIKWSGLHARVLNAFQELGRVTHKLMVFPPFLMAVNSTFILWMGSQQVIGGTMTIGNLVAFQALMANFMGPINDFVMFGGELQNVRSDLNHLDDILKVPLENRASESQLETTRLRGELKFEKVSFGFVKWEPPLLQDIDLLLTPGKRVAVVGKSGSGKTSLARLTAGLAQPTSGTLLIDGLPRETYSEKTLQHNIAFVNQEIMLFEASISDNLCLWDRTLPDKELIRAAKDACIYKEICARGGLQAQVKEGGSNFSGGQRQRLEIARALVTNPSILVLDEATSALDAETENRVEERLRARGCTSLVVAHRLSTIRNCDEIVVLDQGRIVQRGTHDQLLREEGVYRELIRNFEDT